MQVVNGWFVPVVESVCALESGRRAFEVGVTEDVSLVVAAVSALSVQEAVVNEVFLVMGQVTCESSR